VKKVHEKREEKKREEISSLKIAIFNHRGKKESVLWQQLAWMMPARGKSLRERQIFEKRKKSDFKKHISSFYSFSLSAALDILFGE
jgi:hypothetical protein